MFTLDDLKEYLEQRDASDTTFFINPSFLSAIVGLTDDDRLVYDYDKMIAAAIEENPDWTEEDAIEWIDFNPATSSAVYGQQSTNNRVPPASVATSELHIIGEANRFF